MCILYCCILLGFEVVVFSVDGLATVDATVVGSLGAVTTGYSRPRHG